MVELKGLPGAPGASAGKVLLLHHTSRQFSKTPVASLPAEVEKLRAARRRYKDKMQKLRNLTTEQGDDEGAAILSSYIEIAEDEPFFEGVEQSMQNDKTSALWALEQKRKEIMALFEALPEEYMRQRAEDIDNVCWEISCEMEGTKRLETDKGGLQEDYIIFAEDLTPAETIRLDKKKLRGLVTQRGGATSHTVILAKNLGIPAVVGLGDAFLRVKGGEMALLDGDAGTVILSPASAQIQRFSEKILYNKEKNQKYQAAEKQPARTVDGKEIAVCVNMGSEENTKVFKPDSCDGIGLFRTELLYLGRDRYPTDEEQYDLYRQVAELGSGKPVTIRTLDIGGDKTATYLCLPKEHNPFLGYRAIRISLDKPDVFLTQLRSILRASAHGNVRLMFPMIVTLEELLQAKELLNEAKEQLDKRGEKYDPEMPVGIMVETPAAVFLCDRLAPHVDFFSMGTNDLIQYTTATDRMNERVQYLFDPFNISVLRSVGLVCETAQRYGVSVSICGEAASEPLLIPIWVGLGVSSLSVSPALVGRTKYIINHFDSREMQREAQHILGSFGEIEKAKEELRRNYESLGI